MSIAHSLKLLHYTQKMAQTINHRNNYNFLSGKMDEWHNHKPLTTETYFMSFLIKTISEKTTTTTTSIRIEKSSPAFATLSTSCHVSGPRSMLRLQLLLVLSVLLLISNILQIDGCGSSSPLSICGLQFVTHLLIQHQDDWVTNGVTDSVTTFWYYIYVLVHFQQTIKSFSNSHR